MPTKMKNRLASEQELIDDNICPECFNELPEPVYENRDGGYSETVTYCSYCGATFTGRK
jgi:ribosomal protein L17